MIENNNRILSTARLYKIVKIYIQALEDEIQKLDQRIHSAPEGVLKIHRNRNRYIWYQASKDGERRYIRKNEEFFAATLAKKAYYKKLLIEYRKELDALKKYEKSHLDIVSYSNKMLMESPEYSRLLAITMKPDIDCIDNWIEQSYESNPVNPEGLNIRTINGLMVRSKSEAYIAMELSRAKIPYRYECRLDLNGITFYPDFTILHPVTQRLIIWEHFGMMDNTMYLTKTLSKLRTYIENGFLPNDNLITTFESKDNPLDFSMVSTMIEMLLRYDV